MTVTATTARTARPGTVLLLTSGATFLAFLDTTVVNVAFPALRASFSDAAVSTLSWTVSAYAVLLAALLTPAGRLADVLGRKRLFLAALAAFTVASALSAVAPNVETLILFRAVQGAAAAGMIPAALGLVLFETPPEKRAAAVGVWGAAAAMAAVVGPALGGMLIEVESWRSVFLINVPIGLGLLVAGVRSLPADRPTGHQLPDLFGTVAITAGVGLAVAGLTEGPTWGWSSARTLGALAAGAALVAFGLARSRTHAAPAVEIGLWRDRTFAWATAVSFLAGLGMFAWLLCGPLFTASIWDYSILTAALAVTHGAFASAIAATIVGRRVPARYQPAAVVVGMLLFAANAFWMYAALGEEPAFLTVWLPTGLLGGAGLGTTMTALSTVAAGALPAPKFATGVGITLTARQLGGALGIAAAAVILTERGLTSALGFREVFLFTGVSALTAALAGLGLARSQKS